MDRPPPLDSTFGAVFIGVILGAALYGVSCAQVFYYFQNYSKKDGRGTKAIVIATLVFDTVHQMLISHTIYTYTITYFFQPQKLAIMLWSPVIAIFFSALVALLVQAFFVVRIWKLSHRNMIITATLCVFIAAQFVISMVYVAKAINLTMLVGIDKLIPVSIAMNAVAAAVDVLITIVFCVLLRKARTNIQCSDTMIDLLVTFSVQTGMLTSLCAVATCVSVIASPRTFIYVAFYFLLGRLYCNSLLATLNVRDTIREKGHSSFGISMHPIDRSNLSSLANRKDIDVNVKKTYEYITEIGYHDGNGNSSFGPSITHTDDSKVVHTESELESGKASS